MEENKCLEVKKESLFVKVISFIKNIFNFSNKKIAQENNEISKDSKFTDYIKVNKENKVIDSKLINLQLKFESKNILLSELTNEDLVNLNELYKEQILILEDEINQKKIELEKVNKINLS